jgi:predicted PurR-regulated permease PerM
VIEMYSDYLKLKTKLCKMRLLSYSGHIFFFFIFFFFFLLLKTHIMEKKKNNREREREKRISRVPYNSVVRNFKLIKGCTMELQKKLELEGQVKTRSKETSNKPHSK